MEAGGRAPFARGTRPVMDKLAGSGGARRAERMTGERPDCPHSRIRATLRKTVSTLRTVRFAPRSQVKMRDAQRAFHADRHSCLA